MLSDGLSHLFPCRVNHVVHPGGCGQDQLHLPSNHNCSGTCLKEDNRVPNDQYNHNMSGL